MEQNLPTTYQAPAPAANTSIFSDMGAFEGAQRVCKMLASSNLVPSQFQGNIANTMIALEMAQRTGFSPFMVMQGLYVVHGRPAFSAQFIIAAINACGRFSPLHYDIQGEGDDMNCMAWAIEKSSGDRLDGPRVSIKMAKADGWYDKNGSKWKTIPELMLRYRAATFFGRLFAPDILMGMKSEDEIYDSGEIPAPKRGRANGNAAPDVVEAVVVESNNSGPASVEEINAMLQSAPEPAPAQPAAAEPVAEATTEPATGQPLTECQQAEAAPAEAEREAAQEQAKEDDQTAEYRRKMMEYVAEIDSLKAVSEVKWWANNKGYKRLQDELGGKDSQFYMAVMEHQQNRIAELEEAAAKKGK